MNDQEKQKCTFAIHPKNVPTEPGFYPVRRPCIIIGEKDSTEQFHEIALLTGQPPCMELTVLGAKSKGRPLLDARPKIVQYARPGDYTFGHKIDMSFLVKGQQASTDDKQ